MSKQVSETEETHAFVYPSEGEHLSSLLRRCIPKIQAKRANAYNRLNKALRDSSAIRHGSNSSREHSKKDDPFDVFDSTTTQSTAYPVVCAHVTEDLKLCSEAVMKLIDLLSDYRGLKSPICDTPESEVSTALKWLDSLQDLEEKKLVCTVSVHAISRSNAERKKSHSRNALSSSSLMFSSADPEMKQKLASYAKQLNNIDTDINFLMQEIMEYWLECEENR